jgi:hypothetical protein
MEMAGDAAEAGPASPFEPSAGMRMAPVSIARRGAGLFTKDVDSGVNCRIVPWKVELHWYEALPGELAAGLVDRAHLT